MPRTSITPITLTGNGAVLNASAAGTTINATLVTNGANIPLTTTAVPANAFEDRLILYVTNTAASPLAVTVRAGDNTNTLNAPAFEAGKGDLVTGTFTATTGVGFIGPFLASRFTQSGAAGSDQPAGSINVDFATGFTGTITPILLPRAF